MSTVRALVNNKRVSTARQITPATFQQFFPAKVSFRGEDEWKELVSRLYGGSVTFQVEGKVKPSASTSTPAVPPVLPVEEKKISKGSLLDEKNWTFDSHCTQTFPAGKYWIGDICYCLPDEIYDKIFGGVGGYSGGFYRHNDGGFFMVDGTSWGDGCYIGSDGFEYGVDAGIIGIVSEKLIDMENSADSGGKIHTFTHPVTCRFKNGVFRFDSGYEFLKINTQ
jgi:hypothetical protein